MAKKKILLEIEISDDYLVKRKEDIQRYYSGMPVDEIEKTISENPYVKSVAEALENCVADICEGVRSCKATVVD